MKVTPDAHYGHFLFIILITRISFGSASIVKKTFWHYFINDEWYHDMVWRYQLSDMYIFKPFELLVPKEFWIIWLFNLLTTCISLLIRLFQKCVVLHLNRYLSFLAHLATGHVNFSHHLASVVVRTS